MTFKDEQLPREKSFVTRSTVRLSLTIKSFLI